MAAIEDLLGSRYSDLGRHPLFAGTAVPEKEVLADQSYVSVPSLGISMVLPDNDTVETVQLYSDGLYGFSGYRGDLPEGLSFAMSREEARSLLGRPLRSGEARMVMPLGMKQAWDSFACGRIRVHLEYTPGETGIQLISLDMLSPTHFD